MAVTNQQIIDYLLDNPNLSDAQIAATMQEFSISPAQLAQAVNLPTEAVQERYVAAAPNTNTAENINKLASQILSQGTTEAWTGGLPPEKAALYMASDLAKSGVTNIDQIAKGDSGIVNTMTGEKLVSGYGERTGGNLWSGSYEGKGNTGFGVNFDEQGKPVFYSQGASSSTLKNDVLKLAAVAGVAFGIPGVTEGLFGTLGTTGATALTAAEAAGLGLTAAEAASLGLSATEFAAASATAAGAGGGLLTQTAADAAAFELQNAGASALTDLSATTQAGLLTGGKTAAELAAEQLAFETQNAGASALTNTGVKTAAELAAEQLAFETQNAGASALTNTGVKTAAEIAAEKVITDAALAKKIADTANTITSGFKTVGGLLQTEEDKEAAQLAAQNVTAATQAGVAGSQFRPVGMTTRFGTSEYKYDPVTGRMTSAGYQLSPDAKLAQDRLVKLADQGLYQAEAAQGQFAPLQTGAQSLFSLGNQYISRSPQDVAQNYLNQQMQLLQPGREMELANLQNRLYQQGRTGVSVAQGGTMGATTPELQALYNARARQEAELAANAQQLGQRDVLFGAGLLDRGATSMGNYYGGQTQAYSPFTTPLTQIQALETAAQQPLAIGSKLAEQESLAGYRAGDLSLRGTQAASALSTGKAATTNPYAYLFSGVDPAFAQGIAKQIWGG